MNWPLHLPWNHKPNPSREELLLYAERYFIKYQSELTSGTVKARLGHLDITVSFTVVERKN
jgi:hypothetical protein